MTYELAKKLKDAGFTQIGAGGYDIHVNEVRMCEEKGEDVKDYVRRHNIPYIPTLEELIDFSDGDSKIQALYAEYTEKALQKLRRTKESR